MKRITISLCLTLACLLLALLLMKVSDRGGAPAQAAAPKRPNILWLIAEDFGVELGCYGAKEVWTPNLDRLAAEGVRYTKAYMTAPVCSPSRSAFVTGMYQTTIGAHHHRSHRDDGYHLPAGVRILTDWLRDAGYFTANVRELPASLGFKGTGKTDWNFTYDREPFDTDNWADLKAHQPFYAQINFQDRRARPLRRNDVPLPHRPRRALSLHPQLHARPPAAAKERLQGAELSGVESAEGIARAGQADAGAGSSRGSHDASRRTLRPRSRPV